MKINVADGILNMEHGKYKFHVFHKFSGYVLILLTVCFLQYAKAIPLEELMEKAKITRDDVDFMDKFFSKIKNSLNILNYDKNPNTSDPQLYWQIFGNLYARRFVKEVKIFEKYNSLENGDLTLSFLKINRSLDTKSMAQQEPLMLKINPGKLSAVLNDKKTDFNTILESACQDSVNSLFGFNGSINNLQIYCGQYKENFAKEIISEFIFGNLDNEIQNVFRNSNPSINLNSVAAKFSILEYKTLKETLKTISPKATDLQIKSAIEHYFQTAERFLSQWAKLSGIGNGDPDLTTQKLEKLQEAQPKIFTHDAFLRVLGRRNVLKELNNN